MERVAKPGKIDSVARDPSLPMTSTTQPHDTRETLWCRRPGGTCTRDACTTREAGGVVSLCASAAAGVRGLGMSLFLTGCRLRAANPDEMTGPKGKAQPGGWAMD